jgi:hypothetical protein
MMIALGTKMKKTILTFLALAMLAGSAFAQSVRDVQQHIDNLDAQINRLRQQAAERQREEDDEIAESRPSPYGYDKDGLSSSERIVESLAQRRPLLYGQPSVYEQYSEPVEVPSLPGISAEVEELAPVPVPPRPIKYMPMEQQRYWNKIQAEALERQFYIQERINSLKRSEPKPVWE